ncbi:tyrosine-type recombinase/integrase [Roseitalea porphyridii]|uniref:tyrosine-type recombinase/integrase n=1 Tax=Roseitalea porphyridii TaxID=1852022 RepID=UPI003D9A3689
MDLPYITPHAARHVFVSALQAQGVEVGPVAKLAGHANPSVTLGHYTQAVRGGDGRTRSRIPAWARVPAEWRQLIAA